MIAEKLSFSILRFPTGWTRRQSKIVDRLIIQHQLRVYSYPASNGVLVGNAEGDLALISSYVVGKRGEGIDLVSDIIPGTRCAFDIPLGKWPFRNPPVTFGTHILGTKRGESHFVNNGVPFLKARQWRAGEVQFAAPLFKWSDADVVKALRKYGIDWHEPLDEVNGGNIACCAVCLKPSETGEVYCPKEQKTIPVVEWSPTERLAEYQKFVGVLGESV